MNSLQHTLHKKLKCFKLYLLSKNSPPSKLEKVYFNQLILKIHFAQNKKNHILKKIRRNRWKKAIAKFEDDLDEGVNAWLNEQEFHNNYGMSRLSFWKIYNSIKNHKIFKKKTNRSQSISSKISINDSVIIPKNRR